jgi:hypothetical protein
VNPRKILLLVITAAALIFGVGSAAFAEPTELVQTDLIGPVPCLRCLPVRTTCTSTTTTTTAPAPTTTAPVATVVVPVISVVPVPQPAPQPNVIERTVERNVTVNNFTVPDETAPPQVQAPTRFVVQAVTAQPSFTG